MSELALLGSNATDEISDHYNWSNRGGNVNGRAWAVFNQNLLNITNAVFISSFFDSMFNNFYFHLPYVIMFICMVPPFGSPCYSIFLVRIGLTSASVVQILLAGKIQYWTDSILWNSVFVVIHVVHIIVIYKRVKPIKFDDELEQLYERLFQPLKISREQFKNVISSTIMIQSLKCREKFDEEKLTSFACLSLVLSGKLLISKNGIIRQIVLPYQFLNSHEWFNVSVGDFSKVSITAVEDSRVLLWHRDQLRSTIYLDNFLKSVFNHILSQDVVKKLKKANKTMSNRHLPDPFHERQFKTKINMNNEVQTFLHFNEDIEAILKQELKDIKRLSDIIEMDQDTSDV